MAKMTDDLDQMRVVELREQASKAGITGTSHMKKDELIDALQSGEAGKGGSDVADAADQNVIALLIDDHARVKALFEQALSDDDADFAALAIQIADELTLHAEVEEKIFYPALKEKAVEGEDEEAKDEVLEAYVEHASVKQLIAAIKQMEPSDESFKATLQVMSEQVEHHVEEEESEMFKQTRALLSEDELAEIGVRVVAFKKKFKASA